MYPGIRTSRPRVGEAALGARLPTVNAVAAGPLPNDDVYILGGTLLAGTIWRVDANGAIFPPAGA